MQNRRVLLQSRPTGVAQAENFSLDTAPVPAIADGEMLVVEAGATFKHIATSSIGEMLMATPALSDGVMYVRGVSTLFAIGRRK